MELQISELPGQITCVRLLGRLDAPGADRIGTQLTAAVVSQGRPAAIDLSGVEFIASLGIGMRVAIAQARRGHGLRMAAVASPPVRSDLEMTNVAPLFAVVATREDARRALGLE